MLLYFLFLILCPTLYTVFKTLFGTSCLYSCPFFLICGMTSLWLLETLCIVFSPFVYVTKTQVSVDYCLLITLNRKRQKMTRWAPRKSRSCQSLMGVGLKTATSSSRGKFSYNPHGKLTQQSMWCIVLMNWIDLSVLQTEAFKWGDQESHSNYGRAWGPTKRHAGAGTACKPILTCGLIEWTDLCCSL